MFYSKVYSAAIQFQENLVLEALDEIDQYCKHHSWLSEIHHFCKKWSDKSLKEIKGVPAFQIEVTHFLFHANRGKLFVVTYK